MFFSYPSPPSSSSSQRSSPLSVASDRPLLHHHDPEKLVLPPRRHAVGLLWHKPPSSLRIPRRRISVFILIFVSLALFWCTFYAAQDAAEFAGNYGYEDNCRDESTHAPFVQEYNFKQKTSDEVPPVPPDSPADDSPVNGHTSEDSPFQSALQGPPAKSFRDNLRDDKKYITSWANAGWTNDLMAYINMIYLGLQTDRIPILAPFASDHLPQTARPLDFGVPFDVGRFEREIGLPILQWHEVKNANATDAKQDDLGCWSVWAMSNHEKKVRPNRQEEFLKLDVSYTAVPSDVKLLPYPNDWHVSLLGLTKLAFADDRAVALKGKNTVFPSKTHKHTLPPDEQLLCFDYLYFAGTHTSYEYAHEFSPAWRFVGRHLHWSAWMERVGDAYLRRILDAEPSDPVPPFIGMHVRHTDFVNTCTGKKLAVEQCFAPLSAYANAVSSVRTSLLTRSSPHFTLTAEEIEDLPVLVTSDETSQAFWDEVAERGWVRVDHEEEGTEEIYGEWGPPLLDAYFQSAGVGFVGTDRSTMSLLAQKRVQDWRGGVAMAVQWADQDKKQ